MQYLEQFFKGNPKTAIAFSGGVDSAYLLYAAATYGADVTAYFVKTAFQPQFELADAEKLAKHLGVRMQVIPLDILCSRIITENPPDRCYHCKKEIFSAIRDAASRDGYSLLLDGTNASDDATDRPGMRALQEICVRSPLREAGLTKSQIRSLSAQAGLFTWDKPAYACLATRIPTGEVITERKLQRTEEAEDFLFCLGLRDFRVRSMGNTAKLQVRDADLPLVMAHRQQIMQRLGKEYDSILLDLEVRK